MKKIIAILVIASVCLVGCSSEKPLGGTELKGVKVALKPPTNPKIPILHADEALAVLREGGATLTTPDKADLVIEQDFDQLGRSVVRITSGEAIVFYGDYAKRGGSLPPTDEVRKFARERGLGFREEARLRR